MWPLRPPAATRAAGYPPADLDRGVDLPGLRRSQYRTHLRPSGQSACFLVSPLKPSWSPAMKNSVFRPSASIDRPPGHPSTTPNRRRIRRSMKADHQTLSRSRVWLQEQCGRHVAADKSEAGASPAPIARKRAIATTNASRGRLHASCYPAREV
jgi:hypothetical protein